MNIEMIIIGLMGIIAGTSMAGGKPAIALIAASVAYLAWSTAK